MIRFSRILGFFVALNLLAQNLGYLRRGLDVYAGVLLTVVIAGLYAADFFREGKSARLAGELTAVSYGTVLYVLFHLLYENSPRFFQEVCDFSFFLSRKYSYLTLSRAELGPDMFGVPLAASALCWHLGLVLSAEKKKTGETDAGILLAVFNPLVSLFMYLFIYTNIIGPFFLLDYSTAHFLLLLILFPGLYLHYRLVRGSVRGLRFKMTASRRIAAALILSIVAFFSFRALMPGEARGRKVHIFDRGYLGEWKAPDFEGMEGERKAGFFGCLPGFLEARGYRVTVGDITAGILADTDVLVVINLPFKFSQDERKMIYEYVGKGGGLLVLGDHTGISGIREPFNELLRAVNIGFNFDSAKPLASGWLEALRFFPHPVTKDIDSRFAETEIWIGASLTVRPPGKPVIIGTYGFSDAGDPDNRDGFLGDLEYEPGERLGDVILVADARMGRGKILVFGDTSSFQNTALAMSHRFVERVFGWLSESGGGALAGVSPVLPEGKVAYIDYSHAEKFNFRVWHGDAVGGLILNLIRNGYEPLLLKEFDAQRIARADALILIAPLKEFSRGEVDFLVKFVASGGHLIVSSGWDERAPGEALLEGFGFRIGDVPLGKLPPEKTSRGIHVAQGWSVECDSEEAEVLCSAWDYPVIVTRTAGEGRITVIGDSRFLLNANLEDREEYLKANVEFFRQMIAMGETER